MKKKALIVGITGQDGSHLADFLIKKGYIVYGLKRRSSTFNTKNIDHIFDKKKFEKVFKVFYGDLTDSTSILNVIQKSNPDEIYNLGAQSHVMTSFETPEYTANTDAIGCLRILEAIRNLKKKKKQNSIKLQHRRFLVTLKFLKMKIQPLDLQAHMQYQNFMPTGPLLITGRLMVYLL